MIDKKTDALRCASCGNLLISVDAEVSKQLPEEQPLCWSCRKLIRRNRARLRLIKPLTVDKYEVK